MPNPLCRLSAFIPLLLAGCATLEAAYDRHGLTVEQQVEYLGQGRHRIELKGAAQWFDRDAEPLFGQRAEEVARKLGCKSYEISQYEAGVENTMMGGRRYARGVLTCR